jgi:hypothetical protein
MKMENGRRSPGGKWKPPVWEKERLPTVWAKRPSPIPIPRKPFFVAIVMPVVADRRAVY